MATIHNKELEQKAVDIAATLILASVKTAPKARGIDNIVACYLNSKKDIENLALAMEAKYKQKKIKIDSFLRDANNVRGSKSVLLIGVRGSLPKKHELPLNCGACGFRSCYEFIKASKNLGEDFVGPNCAFQLIDLGIALGSAVKLAADLNIDNRIMFTIGTAAKELNLLEASVIIGIPLSVSGKNIFFDR